MANGVGWGEEEPSIELLMTAKVAIGFANMGQPRRRMALPDGRRMTAKGIVKELGLEPFLEPEANDGK